MKVIPSASEKESFLYIILSTRLYIYFVVSVDAGKSFSRLILSFPTPTPIGLYGISFFSVLCAKVNILCKHVQVYVCVLRHICGYGNEDGKHEIWSRHQSSGN